MGFMLPAAVTLFYLLISRKWIVLGEMEFLLGVPVFLVVVAAWYVVVELRNPAYMGHSLWEEHFAPFATTQFKRSEPWYYFFYFGGRVFSLDGSISDHHCRFTEALSDGGTFVFDPVDRFAIRWIFAFSI